MMRLGSMPARQVVAARGAPNELPCRFHGVGGCTSSAAGAVPPPGGARPAQAGVDLTTHGSPAPAGFRPRLCSSAAAAALALTCATVASRFRGRRRPWTQRSRVGRAVTVQEVATQGAEHKDVRRNYERRFVGKQRPGSPMVEYARLTDAEDGDPVVEARMGSTNNNTRREFPLWPGILEERVDFGGLEVPKTLMEALEQRGITQASGIQEKAMNMISLGHQVILDAPTGHGKTLAFLLPILARLQPQMHLGIQALILVPSQELGLQITRELKWLFEVLGGPEQACWFSPQIPSDIASTMVLSRRGIWETMKQDVAVLVTTPGVFIKEMQELRWAKAAFHEAMSYYLTSNLHTIVMDEVDSLCRGARRNGWERSHMDEKKELKKHSGDSERFCTYLINEIRKRYRNRPVQFIASSATADNYSVRESLWRLQMRKWPRKDHHERRIHATVLSDSMGEKKKLSQLDGGLAFSRRMCPPSINHTIVCLDDKDARSLADDKYGLGKLKLIAKVTAKLDGRILVVLPKQVKIDAAVMMLCQAGQTNVMKYKVQAGLSRDNAGAAIADARDMPEGINPNLDEFTKELQRTRSTQEVLDAYRGLDEAVQRGDKFTLLVQDYLVRGVDVEGIDYVVVFELPIAGLYDYLHIAGRTGRMQRDGTVITLAQGSRKEKDICRLIEKQSNIVFHEWHPEEARRGQPLFGNRWEDKPDKSKGLDGDEDAGEDEEDNEPRRQYRDSLQFKERPTVKTALRPSRKQVGLQDDIRQPAGPSLRVGPKAEKAEKKEQQSALARDPQTKEWIPLEKLDLWGAPLPGGSPEGKPGNDAVGAGGGLPDKAAEGAAREPAMAAAADQEPLARDAEAPRVDGATSA